MKKKVEMLQSLVNEALKDLEDIEPTDRVMSILQIANVLVNIGMNERAKELVKVAFTEIKNVESEDTRIELLYQLIEDAIDFGFLDSLEEFLNMLYSELKVASDIELRLSVYDDLSSLLIESGLIGHVKKIKEDMIEAVFLANFDEINSPETLVRVLRKLILVCENNELHEILNKAIDKSNDVSDEDIRTYILTGIMELAFRLGFYELVKRAYQSITTLEGRMNALTDLSEIFVEEIEAELSD